MADVMSEGRGKSGQGHGYAWHQVWGEGSAELGGVEQGYPRDLPGGGEEEEGGVK